MKKATKAWINADNTRKAKVPSNFTSKIIAKNYSIVIYTYNCQKTQRPAVITFRGRSTKIAHHISFKTEERRAKYISDLLNTYTLISEKKKSMRELQVNDVLSATWGYDQTNVDYFLVTKLVGKTMIEIVEIGKHIEYKEFNTGDCVPDITNIKSKPMRKKAIGKSVNIDNVRWASKIEPIYNKNGSKLYNHSSWTLTH